MVAIRRFGVVRAPAAEVWRARVCVERSSAVGRSFYPQRVVGRRNLLLQSACPRVTLTGRSGDGAVAPQATENETICHAAPSVRAWVQLSNVGMSIADACA